MKLRPYHPDDLPALAQLYHDTIHAVGRRDYSQAQVDAWAPAQADLERWRQKLAQEEVIVAELPGEIVGFCSWDDSGYLDFLYVHHAHQRKGIAAALYAAAEQSLRVKGLKHIHTQASVTAQPFFSSPRLPCGETPARKCTRGGFAQCGHGEILGDR